MSLSCSDCAVDIDMAISIGYNFMYDMVLITVMDMMTDLSSID
jgi:hypothetical protein